MLRPPHDPLGRQAQARHTATRDTAIIVLAALAALVAGTLSGVDAAWPGRIDARVLAAAVALALSISMIGLAWVAYDRGRRLRAETTACRKAEASALGETTRAKMLAVRLNAGEETLKTVLNSVTECVVAVDAAGRCRRCNAIALKVFDVASQDELVGRDLDDVLRLRFAGRLGAAGWVFPLRESLRTGEAMRAPNLRLAVSDRVSVEFEAWIHPIVTEGAVVGGIVIFWEVTSRKRAERRLIESEHRLQVFFREARTGFAELTLDGRWIAVNPALCEMLGYSTKELMALNHDAITHPDDLDHDAGWMSRALRGEVTSFQREKRCLHKNGHVVWALVSASVVPDDGGRPQYMIAQFQDISELKSAEARLEHERGFVSTVLSTTSAPIVVLDTEGRIVRFNRGCEAITGYESQDIVGTFLWDRLVPDEDIGESKAMLEALLSGHGEPTSEGRWITRHGRVREILWSSSLLRSNDGRPEHVIYAGLDVTQRNEAIRERDRTYRILSNAIDSIGEAVAVWDGDDRLVLCNSSFRDMLPELADRLTPGLTYREALEAFTTRFGKNDGPARRALLEVRPKVRRQGGSIDNHLGDRWFRVSDHPIGDGMLVTITADITEFIRREEEISAASRRVEAQAFDLRQLADSLDLALRDAEQARIAAETANTAKSTFLATMSHELRTPLNAIIGFSDMIQQKVHGDGAMDRYFEYAADIMESGIHLLELINGILDISKIEAGRIELDMEVLDTRQLLDGCMKFFQSAAHDNGLSLKLSIDEPPPPLFGDERAIKRILFNLVSNATKFTEHGGAIHVRVRAGADGAGVIAVSDTGIGIPADQIPRMLRPFERAENARERAIGGTGLGLSIVKDLVDLHGGTLTIDSEIGTGTTVTVTLPAEGSADRCRQQNDAPVDRVTVEQTPL
ncbi:MAG: PAS domain S-box protein [Rhodospirillaceae bacterium]|nr:PAS domain S-box protein [Rhodospirillaceae bacterium]